MSDLIAIVGRPNVGKSALFNRIVGRRIAIVHDQPGVTRDRQYGYSKIGAVPCVLIDTGGLMPLATGAQVRIADGKLSVVDGPFVEAKEIVGGYAIFELRDKEEAVAMGVEFMQLHKDLVPGWEGTCEVRAFGTPH